MTPSAFSIRDGERVILCEPDFPVVELGRSLWTWKSKFAGRPFRFDSMSFEELRVVSISEVEGGWVLGSVVSEAITQPIPSASVASAITNFCTQVAADLEAVGLEPSAVFG